MSFLAPKLGPGRTAVALAALVALAAIATLPAPATAADDLASAKAAVKLAGKAVNQAKRSVKRLTTKLAKLQARLTKLEGKLAKLADDLADLNLQLAAASSDWLEHDALLQASNYIQAIEERQGLMVACLEEVAYKMGYLSADEVRARGETMRNAYGRYLLGVLEEEAELDLETGARIEILPSHGDITINLHERYYVLRGERVESVWPIIGRGRFH